MSREIKSKEDIILLVDEFYKKANKDPLLGPVFNDVAKVNWEKHLPIMYNFWETTLLGTLTYNGNPMTPHIALNKKVKLTKAHFETWQTLFFETLDEFFTGAKVEETKQRVQSIASLMYYKVNQ